MVSLDRAGLDLDAREIAVDVSDMTRRNGLTWWLLLAGLLGPIILTLAWLAAGHLQEGADARRGSISDLGAGTASKAWLWNAPLTVGGVLIAAFALGLYRTLRPGRVSTIGAPLIAIFGIGLALEGALFQLDCRETVPACKDRSSYSWQHSAHEIESGVGFLALLVAIALLALRFRREPSLRSLWLYSLMTAAAFVVLLLASGASEDSDWEGLVQRLLVTLLLAWIAVIAFRLARRIPAAQDPAEPLAAGSALEPPRSR